ncbi:MAG: DUF58 domain-containing protein [Myxococcota bacterium]|nr:DUF58 domain-containing protein [Myxococcota bacterium]
MSEDALELSPEFLRKLEFLRLSSRRTHAGRLAALQRSRRVGRGIDFADHRPYSPGDSFQDIDWNLYGRLDRLMVRLAEEESELNLHVLVDRSRSMDAAPTGDGLGKSEFVRRVVTALSYVALARLDRVHVYPFGERLGHPLSPKRDKAQALEVYRHLGRVAAMGETDLELAVRSFVEVARVRGVVLVVSDFLAPGGWQRALDLLRHARHEVALLQVTAPEEEEVGLRGEVLLRDSETGGVMRVRVTDAVAKSYRRAFLEHSEGLRSYARANSLFFTRARCDEPFEELLLRTMRSERFLA